ncbi:MAG: zinc-binding alcohol dehydrogenase family protein [Verrucomicrobia bacterium]|nr:zinc-binding alcohol dehydrogenase family protein [Verrucomicrobiota bacterium]
MKALVCKKSADVCHFEAVDLPKPTPGARDLLVKVHYAGLNPIDYKLKRAVWHHGETMRLPGFDVAGEVAAIGSAVTRFKAGDAVYYAGAFNRPGAYAEYHLVDENLVAKKPSNLSFAEAAALPLTLITAWEALFERLLIPEPAATAGTISGNLLIVGAAGGVGSILIQLAKLTGLKVIATASRSESIDWCQQMGADLVLPHGDALIDAARSAGFRWFDFIVNCNDTSDYWNILAELIQPMGRICLLVDAKQPHDLNIYKRKSVGIEWEFMGARTLWPEADASVHGKILNKAKAWLESGHLRPTLCREAGLASPQLIELEHLKLEQGCNIGKTVMRLI